MKTRNNTILSTTQWAGLYSPSMVNEDSHAIDCRGIGFPKSLNDNYVGKANFDMKRLTPKKTFLM